MQLPGFLLRSIRKAGIVIEDLGKADCDDENNHGTGGSRTGGSSDSLSGSNAGALQAPEISERRVPGAYREK